MKLYVTKFTYKERLLHYWLTKCMNSNPNVNGYVSYNRALILGYEKDLAYSYPYFNMKTIGPYRLAYLWF